MNWKIFSLAATAAALSLASLTAAAVDRNGIYYDSCSGSTCTVRDCQGDMCVERTDYFMWDGFGWNYVSSTERMYSKRPVQK